MRGGRSQRLVEPSPPARARCAMRPRSAAVAIGPGPIALTRIPREPRSIAAERTIPSTACLLADIARQMYHPRARR